MTSTMLTLLVILYDMVATTRDSVMKRLKRGRKNRTTGEIKAPLPPDADNT